MYLEIDKMPLVSADCLADVAVICADRKWTWREIHTASLSLAKRLDGADAVCNLCGSYTEFLITWLAALRGGIVQLLPPSRGEADLETLLKIRHCPVVVVDRSSEIGADWLFRNKYLRCDSESATTCLSDSDLYWSPDWDSPLICLYTSGTTGAPEPELKTLGQLVHGAGILGSQIEEELGSSLNELQFIVSSVPPQHMFGMEASLMLSLVHGIPVSANRPLLPEDVAHAFESGGNAGAWITTPVHLQALSRSKTAISNCRAVLSSTMPLAPVVARAARELTDSPVVEIYGSTETGALAIRQAAQESTWRLMPEVRLEAASSGIEAWGAHFHSPCKLSDRIEQVSPKKFRLHGRRTDLIKMGGRRASLSGLSHLLREMLDHIVLDCALYLPESKGLNERLVLIYADETISQDQIRTALQGRVDPLFMPRVFIGINRLPRTAIGKLPRQALDDVYHAWLRCKPVSTLKKRIF